MKWAWAGGSPGLASFEVHQPSPHLWLMQSGVWKNALHEAPHSPQGKPCIDEIQPLGALPAVCSQAKAEDKAGWPRLSWKAWCHSSGLSQGLPEVCLCPAPTSLPSYPCRRCCPSWA